MPSLSLDSIEKASEAQLIAFISEREEPNVTEADRKVAQDINAFEVYCDNEAQALEEYRIFRDAGFDPYSHSIPWGTMMNVDMVTIIYEYSTDVYSPRLADVKRAYAAALNNSYRSKLLQQATRLLKAEIPEEQYIDADIRLLQKEIAELDPLLKHFVTVLHELELNEVKIAEAFGITLGKPNAEVLPEITKGLARIRTLAADHNASTAHERDSLLAILQAKFDLLAFAHNRELLKILTGQIESQREILKQVGSPVKTAPPPPVRHLMNTTDRLFMVQKINRRLFAETDIKIDKEREVLLIQEFLAERAKAIAKQAAKIEKKRKESIKQKVVDIKDDTFDVLRDLTYPIEQAAGAVYGMMNNVITSTTNAFDFAQEFTNEVAWQAQEIRRETNPLKAVTKTYNLASYVSEMYTYVNDVKAEKTSYVTDKFDGFKKTAYKKLSYVWGVLDSLWNKLQNLFGGDTNSNDYQKENVRSNSRSRMPVSTRRKPNDSRYTI